MASIEKRFRIKNGVEIKEFDYLVRGKINGKRISENAGPSKETALELKRSFEDREVRARKGLVITREITLEQAFEKYKIHSQGTKKPATVNNIKWCGTKLLGHFSKESLLTSISKQDFLEFRNSLLGEHSKNGMIVIIRALKAFFSYCVENQYLEKDANPSFGSLKKIKEDKVYYFLSQAEIITLLRFCFIPDLQDLVKFALYTGMRQGEILACRYSWIKKAGITIPHHITKTDETRVIPINKNLQELLNKRQKGEDLVFPGWNKFRTTREFRRAIARMKKKTGQQVRIRFHDLRHTFASRYLEDGGRTPRLRTILGHKTLATLQRYAHCEDQELQASMEAVSYDFDKQPKIAVI